MRTLKLCLALLMLSQIAFAADQACVVCSVEQARYHLEDCEHKSEWNGESFYFCQQACKDRFDAEPEAWSKKFAALDKGPQAPTQLPAFKFPLEPLGSLSSEDLAGKVLVLNLWATWCGPCSEEMPDLVKLQEEYGDKGLVVLALSFDKTKAAHSKGVKALGLNFPSIYADQEAVAEFLAKLGPVSAIPITFIVDTQGRIVERIDGKSTYDRFVKTVEPLLPQTEAPKQTSRRGSVAPS